MCLQKTKRAAVETFEEIVNRYEHRGQTNNITQLTNAKEKKISVSSKYKYPVSSIKINTKKISN